MTMRFIHQYCACHFVVLMIFIVGRLGGKIQRQPRSQNLSENDQIIELSSRIPNNWLSLAD